MSAPEGSGDGMTDQAATDQAATDQAATEQAAMEQAPKQPPKDPMKSFRGVLAGTLVLEAIVVALALPVVAQLGSGISSLQGWSVLAIAVALLVCCAFLRRRYTIWVCLALQVGLIAYVAALPSVAVMGVVFLGVLLWLLKLRRDVASRMAAGTLPSQQASS